MLASGWLTHGALRCSVAPQRTV